MNMDRDELLRECRAEFERALGRIEQMHNNKAISGDTLNESRNRLRPLIARIDAHLHAAPQPSTADRDDACLDELSTVLVAAGLSDWKIEFSPERGQGEGLTLFDSKTIILHWPAGQPSFTLGLHEIAHAKRREGGHDSMFAHEFHALVRKYLEHRQSAENAVSSQQGVGQREAASAAPISETVAGHSGKRLRPFESVSEHSTPVTVEPAPAAPLNEKAAELEVDAAERFANRGRREYE
mgnify:CR=1 FL=1